MNSSVQIVSERYIFVDIYCCNLQSSNLAIFTKTEIRNQMSAMVVYHRHRVIFGSVCAVYHPAWAICDAYSFLR